MRRASMASRGKKKTTFAKLAREHRLRERRIDKQAKKDARKRAAEIEPTTVSAEIQPTTLGDAVEVHGDDDR
jgi:hypothetical protein